ncbi:hypothetical protein [Geobacter sp. AOG2]|uniref:hypothetical protein n=1 Tax=Geobacter sp. AOG2 TaxID=1566347 RepID=UPI001CC7DB8D|nr:hypothetical protein [Geobacter sp. AOG2]GFE61965.1 hypothetical protein AOG2_25530 [Geobacter sp. AOG2]
MKKLLLLMAISLLTAGCIAVPVYDDGYYPPYRTYDYYYGPYPYAYWGTDYVFIGHGGHGGGGFHGRGAPDGGRGYHDRDGARDGGYHGGGYHGRGFSGGRR